MKGGISASALLWLTDFHNDLVSNGRFCLATVNPVYEDVDMVTVVRNTIAGSVGALLTPRPKTGYADDRAFFSVSAGTAAPDKEHVNWELYRTRWPDVASLVPYLKESKS